MIFKNNNVVVTGATSGIGLETSRRLGLLGARLHLLARDPERLRAAKQALGDELGPNAPVFAYTVDVTDRLAVTAAIQTIGGSGGLAALVCSAGIIRVGHFENLAVEDFEATLQTNYLGTLYPTLAAWPYLKAFGRARLGLVSSVAGYAGIYGYTAYAPTKFAVAGLAECLRMEGLSNGIRVTVIFPPDTETPLLAYERAHVPTETHAITSGARCLSASIVAKRFVDGMTRGQFEIYCNYESRVIRLLKTLLPGAYCGVLDRLAARAIKTSAQ
jgi:3-dehydrosphinganine reductase